MPIQLTGSIIADIELLFSIGIILSLFFYLVMRQPVIGLVCFIFLVLTRAHEYVPYSEMFRPSVIAGLVMLAGLFFNLLATRQPLYFTAPQSFLLVAFIAFCWISLFTKGQTIYDFNGKLLIEPLLLVAVSFFVTLNAVRRLRDFRIVLLTLFAIGLTIALLTLVQSFITGIMYGNKWVYESGSDLFTRASSVGINPNGVAMTLTALLPLVFLFYDNEENSAFLRVLLLGSIFLFVLTTFLTFSRAGFVNLIVAFVLIFRKRFAAKYVIGVAFLMITIYNILPSAFWERMVSTTTTDTTGQGRLIIWQAALKMIQVHPLSGVGYAQFPFYISHFSEEIVWKSLTPHNAYLGIAAQTGLINLTIFLSLILVTFSDLRQFMRKDVHVVDPQVVQIADTLYLGLIIILISGLTGDVSEWILLYIYIALVVALKRMQQQTVNSTGLADTKPQKRISHQKIGL